MKPAFLISLLASLVLLFSLNPATTDAQNTLQANADTVDIYPFIPVEADLLANDLIPAGDSILNMIVYPVSPIYRFIDPGFLCTFSLERWGVPAELTTTYLLLSSSGDTSGAPILFRIHDNSYSTLDINNVSALFFSCGNHFFLEDAEYEVPKGSGKTSIFSSNLWIGGKDPAQQLHFAGGKYGQGPYVSAARTKSDFFPGPVMDSLAYSVYQDTTWSRLWNVKKSEIDYHRAHYWEQGYLPIEPILTWPGNGDPQLGQAEKLAPFSDRNGDGVYNPFDGDYPEVRGDQTLFFIFNDDRGYHTETEGVKLGIEIHGMAYAFDLPDDTALKNTVFLYYKIFNRSTNTYDSILFGTFTDIDLGYAQDDYIGCDVERNLYFGYNGTPVDGNGQPEAYGEHPPTQGVLLLGGPLMDPDGIDNPRFDQYGNQLCDESINGLYFGDGIADNERLGLQGFNQCPGEIPGHIFFGSGYLSYANEYYYNLGSYWEENDPFYYGGNGTPETGGYGPACRFIFPGESDTLNWGTGCVPPNGPVNWTEETAGNNPADRRGMGSTGPVTFAPGDVLEIDMAFVWARDYDGTYPGNSVGKLRELTDQINQAFVLNRLPNGEPIYGIENPATSDGQAIKLYPNPTSGMVTLEVPNTRMPAGTRIEILNNQGTSLDQLVVDHPASSVTLNLTGYPSGFYFIAVTTPQTRLVTKVLVMD